ncbi:MAG: glycogen synthase GlgA [Geobacter sp.]|nr:glycogen synthase GlgA [Geobacter sp.]
MKILVAASEVAPFAKTGGLADVTGSLPKALKEMGHDVRIIMPYYSQVKPGAYTIRKGRKSVEIPIEGVLQKGYMRQTYIDGIPVYLLEHRGYFQRQYLYGTPSGDYPDNPQRFAFFCRGVLQLLKKMDFRPDIIHCNDWQTALIPLVMRHELRDDPFFMKTACIYTIHNLAYQGVFDKETLPAMGLDESSFTVDRLEFYDKVNLMKGAILSGDAITTVSETYRSEILGKELGCGLEGVLAKREKELFGIRNGLDYQVWDPAMDSAIAKTYSPSALAGKAADKKALQKELGLAQSPDTPVVSMVARLAAQKGFDLIVKLFKKFQAENLQLVILGEGDEAYVKQLEELRKKKAPNISINLGFDTVLARKIYAGSDIFLMPSRFEPCGLGHLIAQRYGAVPVAHKTGGLADTVFDPQDDVKEANGFLFTKFTADGLWDALQRALETYRDQAAWKKLVKQGMTMDLSWRQSAVKYEEVYRVGLARKVV